MSFILQLYRCNNHFDGDGIGNGVNWHHTFSYLRSLRRCREHEVQCLSAALETVLAGACWPQSRVHSAKPDVSSTCTLCGAQYADSFHSFWGCAYINNLDIDAISSTNYLYEQAIDGFLALPCLWLRAILPSHMAQIPEDENNLVDEPVWSYDLNPPEQGQWPSGDYFGDGAGGNRALYPTLRRCGCAVACMSDQVLQFGAFSPLPGPVQTFPRAEISAALLCILHLADHAIVKFYTYNLPFAEAFNKGLDYCRGNINADLYVHIFTEIRKKQLQFSVRWIPSHLADDPHKERSGKIPEWVTQHHILGNQHAIRI